jgi:uncharacterized protein
MDAPCRKHPRWSSRCVDAQRVFEAVRAIADTGFLVAFVRRADTHHDWAVEMAKQVTDPVLTCEAVLAETAFHLQSSESVLALVREGFVSISFACAEHLEHLASLARRFADRHPDLADLCLIRMSELYPRHTIITIDREDFEIYRRNKHDRIPFIAPPVN